MSELLVSAPVRTIFHFVIASVSEAIQGGLPGTWIASSLRSSQ
jgi:hypothetical protein